MLRISLQTLRARRGTLAGAFVAIWLAVTLASATGLLMAGALGPPGAGRLAATDAVVRADPTVTIGHGEDAEGVDVDPRHPDSVPSSSSASRPCPASPAPWATSPSPPAPGTPRGSTWTPTARTGSSATAGTARRSRRIASPPAARPAGRDDVVADVRLGTRVGATAARRHSGRRRALPRQRSRRRRWRGR